MYPKGVFMVSVLLNWLYIFIVTELIGLGFYQCINRISEQEISFDVSRNTVCGIIITTVYAQFFSLFHKVGLAANLTLLILCIVVIIKNHKIIVQYLHSAGQIAFSWDGVLYLCVLLLFAFATSRGLFHTDTNIYHAQAIRWYEEMGVVKGLGNLQWHFAYNSSYFAFAALFGLSFLGIQSFHCTTGYIAALFCIWALYCLQGFSTHRKHIADMCCVAILLYALINLTGFMSPASDYAAMFFALYLTARWAREIESGQNDIQSFAMLSVLTVFLCTLKLSAGPVVLLAVYPAFHLIKRKHYKSILMYLLLGIAAVLPFLIRNVIISGWLLYPFPAIDLFQVDWKIPVDNVLIDSAQIKVWAKCLYDITLVDMPVRQWLPIWWDSQLGYAKMLIYCNVLAVCLDIVILMHRIIKKERIDINLILLNTVIIMCLATWFVLAPFIRYGLAFLLAAPMLAVGMWLHRKKRGLYQLISGGIVLLMFLMGSPYWGDYSIVDMVYIKHSLAEPYYVMQQDYDTTELRTKDMNGVTIYSPVQEEISGYYNFPTTTYRQMIDEVELRGDTLKDGFRSQKQAR